MGFHVNAEQFDTWLIEQQKTYDIYAPKCFPGDNTFSDVDCIRYGKVSSISEIVFDQKSEYSFKEVLTPISQILFFFTEDQCKEADPPKKGAIIFLRSCDLHALKRLDDLYLHNGPADYYYKRIRDRLKIVLIGCKQSFESCFCVSCGACVKKCEKKSVGALKLQNYRSIRDTQKCIGCGECVINCPNRAWTRSSQKYYRLTLLGRTGKKNPRLGEDFIKWADEDSIIRIILNTYDYVKEYIDPNAPGGKEHIGYIVDRTGFEEFKRWALKGVALPDKAEVSQTMYWKGIKY